MKKIFLSVSFFICVLSFSQTVPDTLSIDDYSVKSIKLPEKLKEISSLEFYDGNFWGLNDSGGKAEIYKIDPKSGKILQTVQIANAQNVDWEEMAIGNDEVFIGDFGNNLGKRKDLTIYYFPVSKLKSEKDVISVTAEKIEFSFLEQKVFNSKNKTTNFDCEAMFFYDGKLHLFTKEWTNLATTHYTLEVKPGKQSAEKIESLKTNYLVTGATVDADPISNTNGFYLTGYTPDGFAFISGFSLPKNGDDLFEEKRTSFSLPLGFTAQVGQIEGIVLKPENPNVLCYSNEEFKFKNFHATQQIQCIYSLAQ